SRAITLGAVLVVAAVAAGAYLTVRSRARAEQATHAAEAARAGLARDTKASLARAAEVLAAAREALPHDPEVLSLSAQVAARLAVDHGDEQARALARELADDPQAGEGALAARYLLAEPGARAAAEEPILALPPGAAPLLQQLAGEILLGRGQVESARGRLDIAAHATPPLLGALADLGDSHLAAGEPERALPFYEAAIAAHPTHPRSVIGAAEARLALERPLDGSTKELKAVEDDAGSAPPLAARLRFELASARVQTATGDAAGADRRLVLAAGALGDSAGLEAARADLLSDARLFEPAEEAAAKALRLEPKAVEHRVRLARARAGLHRYAPALEALEGADGRSVWLWRGVALHGLAQEDKARAALERTVRDGRMTSEAAVWYALADLSLGHADRATALLEKLAAARGASAQAHAALGRALLAAHRPADAEKACRRAVEKDARAPEGYRCQGQLLLAQGKPEEAVAPLEQAQSLDRHDPEIEKLLAAAKAPPKAAPAPKPTPKPVAKPAPAVSKVAPKPAAKAAPAPAKTAAPAPKPAAAQPATPRNSKW
ncbi:MAG TPA: tetratricopeptide repeat protein, partial [Anaeromyxobacteraceae bacterium]|nr:tetratricopeptide repeat protein [Anaeromyxobacteraceae bacterium]